MGLKALVVDDEEDIVEVIQDRLEAYQKIPIIIITTCPDRDAVIEAMTKGANEYLLKPFE